MRLVLSPEEAICLLYDAGCSHEVIEHCKAVAKLAIIIAEACIGKGNIVNLEIVKIGALLHDIGRSKTHGVDHPIKGACIAQSLGLPARIVSIIEKHMGGGITVEGAKKLGWPEKDYTPLTLEEKIVTYADKRIESTDIVPIERTINKLKKQLGTKHPSAGRVLRLHEEIEILTNQNMLKSDSSIQL